MRERLAEALIQSGLFSQVITLSDNRMADSTDLELLVAIPVLKGTVTDVYTYYEMTLDLLLVDTSEATPRSS